MNTADKNSNGPGHNHQMKWCTCTTPQKNAGDNYCKNCDGLIEELIKKPPVIDHEKNVRDLIDMINKHGDMLKYSSKFIEIERQYK